jgi:hypothetical protein
MSMSISVDNVFPLSVGWTGHTSWLQNFQVTRSSSELVCAESAAWWNASKISVYLYRKSLFQSGWHTSQPGYNVWLACKLIIVEENDKKPVHYSHLQNEFNFRLPSTTKLWWLPLSQPWWLKQTGQILFHFIHL